jgi:MFS family permease
MSQTINRQGADFLRAEFAMNLGRGFLLVAFTLQLFRGTGEIWHNLVYVASDALFMFVVPLLAGSWVDRHGPARLVKLCSVAAAAVLAALALVLQWRGTLPDAMLLASVLVGIANAGVRIGVFALVPSLVQASGLANMNGRQQVAFQSGHLVGVLAAGALVDRVGMAPCLIAVAATMAAAGWFYARATEGLAVTAVQRSFSGSLLSGFARMLLPVMRSPVMAWIIVLGAADLVVVAQFNLALPLLVQRHLGGNSLAVSAAGVAFALGSMLLGALVSRHDLDIRHLHRALLAMPIVACAVAAQLLWFNLVGYFALTFVLGFMTALHTVYFTTTVQTLVAPALRGRFAAIRRMTSATLVGGCSYAFAVAYAGFEARGAVLATVAVSMALGACCLAWVLARDAGAKTSHVDLSDEFIKIRDLPEQTAPTLETR